MPHFRDSLFPVSGCPTECSTRSSHFSNLVYFIYLFCLLLNYYYYYYFIIIVIVIVIIIIMFIIIVVGGIKFCNTTLAHHTFVGPIHGLWTASGHLRGVPGGDAARPGVPGGAGAGRGYQGGYKTRKKRGKKNAHTIRGVFSAGFPGKRRRNKHLNW